MKKSLLITITFLLLNIVTFAQKLDDKIYKTLKNYYEVLICDTCFCEFDTVLNDNQMNKKTCLKVLTEESVEPVIIYFYHYKTMSRPDGEIKNVNVYVNKYLFQDDELRYQYIFIFYKNIIALIKSPSNDFQKGEELYYLLEREGIFLF